MSFLTALRTRLNGPVAACVQAAKAAAERAIIRQPTLRDAAPHAAAGAAVLALAPETDPLEESRMHLARLSVALACCGDAAVAAAGARFQGAVRTLLDALDRHPAAMPDHRRPLAAWVPGLAAATERFVSLQRERPCRDRRDELVAVLEQVARRVHAHVREVEGPSTVAQPA